MDPLTLRDHKPRNGRDHAREPAFVGRDGELAALTEALTGDAGTARLVFVQGEAGIGKTRLMDELLARLGSAFHVFRGAGHDLGRERPFGLITDAIGVSGDGTDPARARPSPPC